MSIIPVIAFGQQPCGFFPRRFLVAKVRTARRLQQEMGGEIVFFYHDADHDPRETQTFLRHPGASQARPLNFSFVNKIQRKYSPLYCKDVSPQWQICMTRQLGALVSKAAVSTFRQVRAHAVADFCLEMYRAMGLLDQVRVVRSSDPAVRQAACEIDDFFVDVPWQGEMVRARCSDGKTLRLHRGGDAYLTLPETAFGPSQISPARDTRLRWMQSVIHCTHYITGAGERAYLRPTDASDIVLVDRDEIDRSSEAYVDLPI